MGNKSFITYKVCERCNNQLGAYVDNYLTDHVLIKMKRKNMKLFGKGKKDVKIFPSCLTDINGTVSSENVDMLLWNISIILLCFLIFYLIGVFIQELYSNLYSGSNLKHNTGSSEKKNTENIYCDSIMSKVFKIISRLIIKVRQGNYIDNLFEDSELITNSIKRKKYKQYAEDIAKKKDYLRKTKLSMIKNYHHIFSLIVFITFKFAGKIRNSKN